ncbi:hypothetical protein LptCag_2539 [Leptospirillum ferriphilum]|uniref:Uncharacterized protein n=1 Tax=Leptospirillum ferriphilum TaxID=178606 RepID=A0A094WEZ5_9BACT|nr:hypothetical protein ABH19_01880 [Leptospirillum sp. Group II 'CF-1']KGA95105.1 hypothetical protein LptCag_2539 [Leptospirillum ferriphilum]
MTRFQACSLQKPRTGFFREQIGHTCLSRKSSFRRSAPCIPIYQDALGESGNSVEKKPFPGNTLQRTASCLFQGVHQ